MVSWVPLLVAAGASTASAERRITERQLARLWTEGEARVEPDPATRAEVTAAGLGELRATVELCLTRTGEVSSADVVESSGVAAYDAAIRQAARSSWRFRPYRKKKKAIAVCATVAVGWSAGDDGGIVAPPAPPPEPEITTPSALEALRLTGERTILPDPAIRDAIARSGKARIVVPFKLCVDEAGVVTSVKILKSSGFSDYDDAIYRAATAWTYRPFKIDGAPAPVCAAVTIVFRPD